MAVNRFSSSGYRTIIRFMAIKIEIVKSMRRLRSTVWLSIIGTISTSYFYQIILNKVNTIKERSINLFDQLIDDGLAYSIFTDLRLIDRNVRDSVQTINYLNMVAITPFIDLFTWYSVQSKANQLCRSTIHCDVFGYYQICLD